MSEDEICEQASALASKDYVRNGFDANIELSARGKAAAALGQQVLRDVEQRWRKRLGDADFDDFAASAARLTLGGGR